jgi:hypothetical protein
MAKKDYDKLFNDIILDIIDNNKAVRDAIKDRMSITKFYALLEGSDKKTEQYMRATKIRSDSMGSEILEIADNQENDVITNDEGIEIINHNVINRSRLRVDTRKWLMSKMQPKKYGDKVELDHKGGIAITGINYIVPKDGDNASTDK